MAQQGNTPATSDEPMPPCPPSTQVPPVSQQGPAAPIAQQTALPTLPCPPLQQRMPMYPPSSTPQPNAPQMSPYGWQVSLFPLIHLVYFLIKNCFS